MLLDRFWSDALLLDSIQKDVIRTYPDLKFFLDSEGRHQEAMQNILFLYAKLNPGIKYVQVAYLAVLLSCSMTSPHRA